MTAKRTTTATHFASDWERQSFMKELDSLRRVTAGCRVSMHEPDEQGVTAEVTGSLLDNSGAGNELMVRITRAYSDGATRREFTIDLASLIALARMADVRAADRHGVPNQA